MNKYEEKAKRIMERGDFILAKRKKRIIKISSAAGAITGICAVFAIGYGIWNNTSLKESAKPPVIDDNSIIVSTDEGSTEETTAYRESDVQESSENTKNEINVTTEKITNEKTTEPAVSVTASVNQTLPANEDTTAGKSTSPAHTSVTSVKHTTTVKNTSAGSLKTTTAASPTTAGFETTTTKKPSTESPTESRQPPTESPIPPPTESPQYPTNSPVPPPTESPQPPTESPIPPPTDGTVEPPANEFVFGSNRIKYCCLGYILNKKNVDDYLGKLSDTAEIYSIVDTPVEDAVAAKNIKEGDSDVYFLYCNLLQKYTDSESKITYTKSYENDFPEDIFIFEKSVEISENIECLNKTIKYNAEIYYLDGISPNEMIGIKNDYSDSIELYYNYNEAYNTDTRKLKVYKNLSSQDIAHVFSANFADDCIIKPCNTSSITAAFFFVLDKIMLENPHTLLVKTGSNLGWNVKLPRIKIKFKYKE